MMKSFRFHAKCLHYYTNTYEAETYEEASDMAHKSLSKNNTSYWEETSNDDPIIFDSYEDEDSDSDDKEES